MASNQHLNIETIEDGHRAVAVAGYIRETVDDQMRMHVTGLISIYRNGKIDHDQLVGKVAEIAALEGLMSELENRAQRGVAAANREYNSGKTR
jgi:hypothetical protein